MTSFIDKLFIGFPRCSKIVYYKPINLLNSFQNISKIWREKTNVKCLLKINSGQATTLSSKINLVFDDVHKCL